MENWVATLSLYKIINCKIPASTCAINLSNSFRSVDGTIGFGEKPFIVFPKVNFSTRNHFRKNLGMKCYDFMFFQDKGWILLDI